jgi:hypothetical protein
VLEEELELVLVFEELFWEEPEFNELASVVIGLIFYELANWVKLEFKLSEEFIEVLVPVVWF